MRHIRLLAQTPDAMWLNRANALLEELTAAPTDEARNAIIDGNRDVWGGLKDWLLSLSHGKCWFSEAKDCFSHWDVEHYRPKKAAKDVDGTPHAGYWWLAFDWKNLRICGNAGNRMKGTYFPLRPGCARVTIGGDIRLEDAILLDPVDDDDPALLSFDLEGRALAAAHVRDAWERERVEYSVRRYNLDFPPLMDKRKTLWAECWRRVQEYLRELATYHADTTNAVAKDRYKQAARGVRALMSGEQEFSAVARACVLSSGDPRLAGLLQSA